MCFAKTETDRTMPLHINPSSAELCSHLLSDLLRVIHSLSTRAHEPDTGLQAKAALLSCRDSGFASM